MNGCGQRCGSAAHRRFSIPDCDLSGTDLYYFPSEDQYWEAASQINSPKGPARRDLMQEFAASESEFYFFDGAYDQPSPLAYSPQSGPSGLHRPECPNFDYDLQPTWALPERRGKQIPGRPFAQKNALVLPPPPPPPAPLSPPPPYPYALQQRLPDHVWQENQCDVIAGGSPLDKVRRVLDFGSDLEEDENRMEDGDPTIPWKEDPCEEDEPPPSPAGITTNSLEVTLDPHSPGAAQVNRFMVSLVRDDSPKKTTSEQESTAKAEAPESSQATAAAGACVAGCTVRRSAAEELQAEVPPEVRALFTSVANVMASEGTAGVRAGRVHLRALVTPKRGPPPPPPPPSPPAAPVAPAVPAAPVASAAATPTPVREAAEAEVSVIPKPSAHDLIMQASAAGISDNLVYQ